MLSPALAPLSKTRRWAATTVLTASLLVITLDMTILNIALPEIAADLHPTSDQQLWIIDVYSLVLAGLLVPFAAIADRWGRKRMLMLGYSLFGGASLLVFFADSAEMVIAIRALLGIGGAMIMPVTLSLIRVIFTDPRERATALSIWAAVSGLGSAFGPLVGGVLLEHFSWHAAFLVNVPLMAVGVIAGIAILPESRVPNAGRWDAFAAVLSLVGMTLTIWAIKTFGERASLAVPEALIAFFAGGALLAWFVVRCMRSDAPLLELRLFRNRTFSAGIVAALGSTFAVAAAFLLITQWMQLVEGISPVMAGVQMLPAALSGAVASLAAPPLARLIGARAVIGGGLGIAGVGMLIVGFAPGELGYAAVCAALVCVGVGTGSLAIGSAMIMLGSPEEKAGNAGALEETSYELGAVLGVTILGSVASLMYRASLDSSGVLGRLAAGGPGGAERAGEARESLGAAVAIADEARLPELAEAAGRAFTHGLQTTGIAAGIIMLAVAALVFVMTPRRLDLSGTAH